MAHSLFAYATLIWYAVYSQIISEHIQVKFKYYFCQIQILFLSYLDTISLKVKYFCQVQIFLSYWDISVQFKYFYFSFFIAFDFLSVLCGHSFFHPCHNGQWPPTLKDFLSQILPNAFIFLSLFLIYVLTYFCNLVLHTMRSCQLTKIAWSCSSFRAPVSCSGL